MNAKSDSSDGKLGRGMGMGTRLDYLGTPYKTEEIRYD